MSENENKDEFIQSVNKEVEKVAQSGECGEDVIESRREAIMEILNISAKNQRLYFIIRSIIMGLISASVTFSIVLYFSSINFLQTVILGIFLFIFSLITSRLLDREILLLSKKIVKYLERHKKLKKIILDNF